jgi:hypothetical protein
MSNQEQHPDSEMLMRGALGELQQGEVASFRDHLSTCDQCRMEVEEARETCTEFRAFYQTDYKPSLPPPPHGWQTFRPALDKRQSPSTFGRLRAMFSRPLPLRHLGQATVAASLALLLVFAVYRMRQAPAVSANEILERSVAAETQALGKISRATVYQKIRVRRGSKTYVRTLYRDVVGNRQVEHSDSQASELAGSFQAIRYNWADPLSAGGIRSWLAAREGEDRSASETVRQSDGLFTVSSTSSQDLVQEARFVVREADYHPVSAHFDLRGQEDLELTELAYSIQPVDTIDNDIRAELIPLAEPSPERLPTGKIPSHAAAEPDLDSVEIQARFALHRRDADLGEETQVERAPGAVIVKGLVSSDQRRAELRDALAHLQGIRIELETADEAAGRQARAIASAAESPRGEPRRPPALQKALAERFADQEARDAFVLATIECSQRTLSHGFALRNLAERYTTAAAAALSDESQRQLATMIADHRRAMETGAQELFDRLTPVAGAVPQAATIDSPARPWQEVQQSLLTDLRKMDQLVIELVSSSAKGAADPAAVLAEYHLCANRVRSELATLHGDNQ